MLSSIESKSTSKASPGIRASKGMRQWASLLSIFGILLPVLFGGILFINYHNSFTVAGINSDNMRLALSVRQNVATFLHSHLQTIRLLATLQDASGISHLFETALLTSVENNRIYESILALDSAGVVKKLAARSTLKLNRNDIVGMDLSETPHMASARGSGEPVWSDTFISPISGEPALSLALSATKGGVLINLNLGELSRFIAAEREYSGANIFLVNNKGRVIAHRDRTRVLEQHNAADTAAVQAGLRGEEGNLEYSVNGVDKIGAVLKIPDTNWLVIVERNSTEVYAAQNRMESLLMALLSGVLALLLWFLYCLDRRIVKPVIALSAGTKELVQGNMKRIEQMPNSFVELEDLKNNFNVMVAAIASREGKLQAKNAELEDEIMRRSAIEMSLQERNEELASIEEELRGQVDEYMSISDQLLATEEMLRVQLETVEESSHKFKAVFEHSPITVALTTLPEGKFIEVNQGFVEMFGFSEEEAVGKTTLELRVWEHEGDRHEFVQKLRESGRVVNFRTRMRRKGGDVFTVLFSGALVEIAGKRCVLSALIDISEQVRLQHQLLQSQKMDVVGQLAGGIAHDFNNMLSVILAAAELMKRDRSDETRNSELLENIVSAASRSSDLTRELLVFSRKGVNDSTPLYVNEVVDTVIGLLKRTIDKSISVLFLRCDDNPVIKADQSKLQNALLNLGINARDAMPDGGTLTFAVALRELDDSAADSLDLKMRAGSYVEISVSDTGCGMSQDIMEHIFEPFFTTKEVGKGTGLGLAAVYGMVGALNGAITVKSEPGEGAVFTVYIPMAVVGSSQLTEKRPAVIKGGGKILLVDDEELLRYLGSEMLESLGYSVIPAVNGLHALELYEKHRSEIDLVMLDVMMPVMGGKEAFAKLKERYPEVRVLVCSGYSQKMMADEFFANGAAGFVRKPYSLAGLSQTVALALGHKAPSDDC